MSMSIALSVPSCIFNLLNNSSKIGKVQIYLFTYLYFFNLAASLVTWQCGKCLKKQRRCTYRALTIPNDNSRIQRQ